MKRSFFCFFLSGPWGKGLKSRGAVSEIGLKFVGWGNAVRKLNQKIFLWREDHLFRGYMVVELVLVDLGDWRSSSGTADVVSIS